MTSEGCKTQTLSWIAYYAAILVAGGFGLAKGFVFAKLLGVTGYGGYALLMLIASYGELLYGGSFLRGLECHLPFMHGSGRAAEANQLRDQALTFLLIIALPFVAIGWVVSLSLPALSVYPVVFGGAVVTVTSGLFVLVTQDLRARQSRFSFATLVLGRSVLTAAAGALCITYWGWYGALGVEVIIPFVLFAVIAGTLNAPFRLCKPSYRAAAVLVRSGFPLASRNLINGLTVNLDRWVVALSFGVVAFGSYAFAMLIVSAGLVVHMSLSTSLGPLYAHEFGKGEALPTIMAKCDRIVAALLVTGAVAIYPSSVVVTKVISSFFSEYSTSIPIVPYALAAAVFQVASQYDCIAIMTDNARRLLPPTAALLTVAGALLGVLLFLRADIHLFAGVVVVSRLGNLIGQRWVAARLAKRL